MLPNSVDISKTNSNDSMSLLDSISDATVNITDRVLVHHRVEEMGKTIKEMPIESGDIGSPVPGVEMMEEDMEIGTDYNRVVSSEDPFILPPTAMNG